MCHNCLTAMDEIFAEWWSWHTTSWARQDYFVSHNFIQISKNLTFNFQILRHTLLYAHRRRKLHSIPGNLCKSIIKHILQVDKTFIYTLLHISTSHISTSTFRSLSDTFVRRSLFSSSGSCDGSDVTWQEIGRMCGSVCSCPHLGSLERRPSFRICTVSLIHLVLLSDSLSKIVDASQLITLSWLAWSVKAD